MSFSQLPHDIMGLIWDEKVKIEKLEKAQAFSRRNHKRVMKELELRNIKLDVVDLEVNYNIYGFGKNHTNLFYDIVDELDLDHLSIEEQEERVELFIFHQGIYPIKKEHRIFYYRRCKKGRTILYYINQDKIDTRKKIADMKGARFRLNRHIFGQIHMIKYNCWEDYELDEKYFFLRDTKKYGYGGHMCGDKEPYGTKIYRESLEVEPEPEPEPSPEPEKQYCFLEEDEDGDAIISGDFYMGDTDTLQDLLDFVTEQEGV